MAEGGPPPRLDSHLLECPICLEELRQPKSLPCLHTFCQDCLGTYITKELSGKISAATSFPCPICRVVTHPVRQADSKEIWAQQFQTRSLIQELIQLRELTSEPLYCKPCQSKENMATPAIVWCKTLNAGFCEVCKVDHHDLIHTECSLLDVDGNIGIGLLQGTSTLKCSKHSEKLDCYCGDHQLLGCNKCVFLDHRRCEEVTTAIEYYTRLKNDSTLEDMKASLLIAEEALGSLVKDFGEQLELMMQHQDIALKSITDLRERIDKRLDQLQKDITDNLVSSFKEEKNKIEASLQQCERLMTGIDLTMKSSAAALVRDDNIETILLYHRGQAEVASCIDLVTEMRKSYTSVTIIHEIDPNLVTLDNNTRLTLGEISMPKKRRRFPALLGYLGTPLSEKRAKEIGKFNIKRPSDTTHCYSRGVVYLPDGHIVVGDYHNKKLKLFTDEGQYQAELPVRGCPVDMSLVDNNTVAVAVNNPNGVRVVKVGSSKLSLSSEINMSNQKICLGIAYADGKFVVSTTGQAVYSLTEDGTAHILHTYSAASYSLASDPHQGQILVSLTTNADGGVALSRLSSSKQPTTILKVGVVRNVRGIDVDLESNLYLCGHSSNNVVQLSADGTRVRELLTSSDGINSPLAIAVCGDKFVVTNLSDQERNSIRVFQLY